MNEAALDVGDGLVLRTETFSHDPHRLVSIDRVCTREEIDGRVIELGPRVDRRLERPGRPLHLLGEVLLALRQVLLELVELLCERVVRVAAVVALVA